MKARQPVFALQQLYRTPVANEGLVAEEVLAVSAATKRIAFTYERFRNTLEPDEADVLRRKAMVRILARRLQEGRSAHQTSVALLQELIRGHYIQHVKQTVFERIKQEVEQLQSLYGQLSPHLQEWFLGIEAVSIDRELFPRQREEGLVHVMYHDTYPRLVWLDDLVKEADRPSQLYVACHRALFASDDLEISYHYFLNEFPEWKQNLLTSETTVRFINEAPLLYKKMQTILTHPAGHRILLALKAPAVPYRVLRDVFQGTSGDVVSNHDTFTAAVTSAIENRRQRLTARLNRRASHSVWFLLCTKSFLTLVLELPYEFWLLGKVHWTALLANTLFHPLALFFLATTVRLPGQANTDALLQAATTIATGEGELPTIVIRSPRRYGPVTWSFFAIFYAALFVGIFSVLFKILDSFQFSLLAMFLFVIFLGLVSFLAVRVRRSADEIRFLPKKEGAFSLVLSFLILPLLEFGSYLSRGIRELNVPLFLMDRVIEAPFKLLIDVTEEWFAFVKDRREEIV